LLSDEEYAYVYGYAYVEDEDDMDERDGVEEVLALLFKDGVLLFCGRILHVVLQFPHVNCGCTHDDVYRYRCVARGDKLAEEDPEEDAEDDRLEDDDEDRDDRHGALALRVTLPSPLIPISLGDDLLMLVWHLPPPPLARNN